MTDIHLETARVIGLSSEDLVKEADHITSYRGIESPGPITEAQVFGEIAHRKAIIAQNLHELVLSHSVIPIDLAREHTMLVVGRSAIPPSV